MNEYPEFVKRKLLSIIDDMSTHTNDFVRTPGKDLSDHELWILKP